MCLLVNQPAMTFTNDFLLDVYSKNSDGLGIMFAADNKVQVRKIVPKTAKDFIDFYNEFAAERACVWHARMMTHGDINLENCHPYKVTDDIWLAHNGVLSMGNDANPRMSDTWHFIDKILHPALRHNPDLMEDKDWIRYIERIIGTSNKFSMVRSDGLIQTLNKASGVEFEGAWLSNTYAWSPSMFGFRPTQTYQTGGYYGKYSSYDRYFESDNGVAYLPYKGKGNNNANSSSDKKEEEASSKAPVSKETAKRLVRAAYNQWSRRGAAGLEQWVLDAPSKAEQLLTFWWEGQYPGLEDLPYTDPGEAAAWLEELFYGESGINEAWLQ